MSTSLPSLIKHKAVSHLTVDRRRGKIATGGTMVMLPVLFFSILVRKFPVHGLTAGALKG